MKLPADTTIEGGIRVISAARAALIARVSKLDWLTTDEAALYCRVGVSTFERMVRDLPIPFVRPAGPKGDRRFYRAHLDSALLAAVLAFLSKRLDRVVTYEEAFGSPKRRKKAA